MQSNVKESVRLTRFILIGTLNALITAVVVWISMDLLHINYIWSNVLAYLIAQIHNFFWSKYWIFTSSDGSFVREIPSFALSFGLAYGLQFLALLLMVEVLGINEYLAQFIGLFVYGASNYLFNRFLTFGKLDKKRQSSTFSDKDDVIR